MINHENAFSCWPRPTTPSPISHGSFHKVKKTYHSRENVVVVVVLLVVVAGGKVMVCGRMVMCRRVSIVLVVVKSHVLYMALT